MPIIKIDTCLSTNAFLKELLKNQAMEEGSLVVTRNQTDGRGQIGTHWESEPGKNLTFSLILYPDFLPLKEHFLLSETVALGIKTVLDTYAEPVTIKWPNDIYYQNQKIAGILIENAITGQTFSHSIIGIGLNVNQETFLSGAPDPVSLKQISGKETDLDMLLEQLSTSILHYYQLLKNGQSKIIAQAYEQNLYRKTGFYDYEDQEGLFSARIESVDRAGFLHLITATGERRCYTFKEVAYR
jgi:BirA family biotin operon repressor/biotin-[acetyl-CoA-carboxylase] ligase